MNAIARMLSLRAELWSARTTKIENALKTAREFERELREAAEAINTDEQSFEFPEAATNDALLEVCAEVRSLIRHPLYRDILVTETAVLLARANRGLVHRDALLMLFLVQGDLLSNDMRHAAQQLHSLIAESELFDLGDDGVYRLKEAVPARPEREPAVADLREIPVVYVPLAELKFRLEAGEINQDEYNAALDANEEAVKRGLECRTVAVESGCGDEEPKAEDDAAPEPEVDSTTKSSDPYTGLTTREAATLVLREAAKPLSTSNIASLMVGRGFEHSCSSFENFVSSVRSILRRSKDFEQYLGRHYFAGKMDDFKVPFEANAAAEEPVEDPKRLCSTPECGGDHHAKGLCKKCYGAVERATQKAEREAEAAAEDEKKRREADKTLREAATLADKTGEAEPAGAPESAQRSADGLSSREQEIFESLKEQAANGVPEPLPS